MHGYLQGHFLARHLRADVMQVPLMWSRKKCSSSIVTAYVSYKLNILCKNLNHSYNARGQSASQAAW